MHRGSSKGATGPTAAPETLPLSASPPTFHSVALEILRGGRSQVVERTVRDGTLLRDLLRSAGQAPEGSAVLLDGTPQPLDTPIQGGARYTVLPTFSGG
jgi:sulfur carrier protein ThiS